jgi:hypothetical protein
VNQARAGLTFSDEPGTYIPGELGILRPRSRRDLRRSAALPGPFPRRAHPISQREPEPGPSFSRSHAAQGHAVQPLPPLRARAPTRSAGHGPGEGGLEAGGPTHPHRAGPEDLPRARPAAADALDGVEVGVLVLDAGAMVVRAGRDQQVGRRNAHTQPATVGDVEHISSSEPSPRLPSSVERERRSGHDCARTAGETASHFSSDQALRVHVGRFSPEPTYGPGS